MDITDEMAKREARRCETLRVLKQQAASAIAIDEIELIYRDLLCIAQKDGFLWASLYVFSLGRIYGVRQERARRAKRHDR